MGAAGELGLREAVDPLIELVRARLYWNHSCARDVREVVREATDETTGRCAESHGCAVRALNAPTASALPGHAIIPS